MSSYLSFCKVLSSQPVDFHQIGKEAPAFFSKPLEALKSRRPFAACWSSTSNLKVWSGKNILVSLPSNHQLAANYLPKSLLYMISWFASTEGWYTDLVHIQHVANTHNRLVWGSGIFAIQQLTIIHIHLDLRTHVPPNAIPGNRRKAVRASAFFWGGVKGQCFEVTEKKSTPLKFTIAP